MENIDNPKLDSCKRREGSLVERGHVG